MRRRLPGLVMGFHVTGHDLIDDAYMTSVGEVAAEGAAGLAVEISYPEFHPGVARGRTCVGVDRARQPRRGSRVTPHTRRGGTDRTNSVVRASTTRAAVAANVDVVKFTMALLGWERTRLAGLVARLHDHGKVVLVEGVESAAHERLAVETGVDLASGYRYAPSMTEPRGSSSIWTERPRGSSNLGACHSSTSPASRARESQRCATTVAPARRRRAHDTDQDENAVWVNRKTGEVTAVANAADRGRPGWLDDQEWRVVPSRVQALVGRAADRLVFLCGSTANEDEVWHLFSRVIYLAIDEPTLRDRLTSRTSNDFGKTPWELEAILSWHQVGEADYERFGAVIVDATLPLHDVVDKVLEAAAGAGTGKTVRARAVGSATDRRCGACGSTSSPTTMRPTASSPASRICEHSSLAPTESKTSTRWLPTRDSA